MGIKNNVFASRPERNYYYKLSRQWGDTYRIYHNLPFLNIFDLKNVYEYYSSKPSDRSLITFNEIEISRLKKTSIDYVLCDQQDMPLIGIDFDGLQNGFNSGITYISQSHNPPNPWRKDIMHLKLKVAHGSDFPYFVLGYDFFQDLTQDVSLMIIDGIIGTVLATIEHSDMYTQGYDDFQNGRLSSDSLLYKLFSKGSFTVSDDIPLLEDILKLERRILTKHNPIRQEVRRLYYLLNKPKIIIYPLEYPQLERSDLLMPQHLQDKKIIMKGVKCRVISDMYGSAEQVVWVPNVIAPYFSLGLLLKDIARLVTMNTLLNKRN